MEFEYTAMIFIEESDLKTMCEYVREGGDFADIFDTTMSYYDDCDYYASGNIYDQVKEEVEKRVKKANKED